MATRREIKQDAVARVREQRAARRARKAELAAMPADERKAAKAEDKQAAREAKKTAKAERAQVRAGMTRAERRADKRRDRINRKVAHRPRRAIGWGVVAAVVAIVAVVAAPVVGDVRRLLSVEVDTTTAAGAEAREYGAEVAEHISDEGIVMLENEENALPLADRTLNVFSFASFNLRYGGGGSGGADQSSAVNLYDALSEQGIEYNRELYSAMQDAGAKTEDGTGGGVTQLAGTLLGGKDEDEPAPDYLTDDVLAQAQEFSGTALVVVGNQAAETQDFTADELSLSDNQHALLDVVTSRFDDVVVVVNSGNQMELGFLEEYPQIKGALWIGTPGPRGAVSLAKALAGEVNPSGKLTDTYAYELDSAPATENVGDFRYDNVDRAFLDYEEGIYVGYRYYETRYGDDEAAYAKAVQYPFGHGLSYTTFDWKGTEPQVRDGSISLDVEVTNTGDVAGKDVVQVYFSAPYTPGGIEKSVIELAGYAKTSLLEPGQSETVTVAFDERDMSSWDGEAGHYVLEKGRYDITAGTDVHTPVLEYATTVAKDVVYDTDADTGVELTNRFGYAEGDLTYLSRDDWDGTYPDASDRATSGSDDVLARMDPQIEPAEGEEPTYGADHGIMLEDLKGLDYDDPQWEKFLDQFTREELTDVFARGAYQTTAVERLGMPSAVLLDGPAGLNYFFGDVTAASFPTEVVVASTWNDDLARELGESVGAEANAYGVQGWYAPGMNVHRSPLGGRDFEFFSEDPLLSGTMSAAVVSGAQSKGLITFMKHFALNEQEVNARSGVNVFVDEQALREVYLRPFEITVKEGDANGAMTSFINIGGSWAGGNPDLLQGVLRGEWGFEGVVSTDAVLGGWMDPGLAARYGNDLMLAPLGSSVVKATNEAYEADPVGIGNGLRDRVHTVAYALLQTDLFN